MAFVHTEESRVKMSEAWKRRRLIPVSAETRAKMSTSRHGRKFTEEHRKNLSLALMGKNAGKRHAHTEESRRKLSLAKTGKPKAARSTPVTEEERAMRRRNTLGQKNPQWKDGRSHNKEYMRHLKATHTHKRRLRIMKNPTLTFDQWQLIKSFFGNMCPSCGSKHELQIDHIIPISRGGEHSAENVQPLCGPCNLRKGTKTIKYAPYVA